MLITVIAIAIGLGFILYTPRLAWVKASLKYLIGGFCLWAAIVFASQILEEKLIRGTGLAMLGISVFLFVADMLASFSGWLGEKVVGIFRKTAKVPPYVMEIWTAMERMASRKVGALIILQRKQFLRPHMKGGMPFDAEIKSEILVPLFLTSSPVHDGALVVHKGRIQTVKGILPLASLSDIAPSFGTRHRAAIGITERTDAIALVVSEERGEISVAYRGCLVKISDQAEFVRMTGAALKGKNLLRLKNVDFVVTTKVLDDLA
ncbi:MAG TPA: DNA integrity scanning protein DisA nucleotide-binding domain protein [Candidatus Omnitrophota bacterium]|nr:DNA integrity scanning protein DisA nucleotide-binding domain protein [Candidatus Omnitrophota bacterium]HPS36691.1 DNA integrity scanning protein DisA nucleotide-binding domain protein [Candidatus Omnitrophota bacterium]